MKYLWKYETPYEFSNIVMISDGEFLIELGFEGYGTFEDMDEYAECVQEKLPVFEDTEKWLDIYFSGKEPGFMPKFKILGATPFREEVMECLLEIPYGETVSYKDIAEKIAAKRGQKKMSAQAVGQAVGWNPICIIVPCHRVVGSDGSITGYGAGIPNKRALLDIEQ